MPSTPSPLWPGYDAAGEDELLDLLNGKDRRRARRRGRLRRRARDARLRPGRSRATSGSSARTRRRTTTRRCTRGGPDPLGGRRLVAPEVANPPDRVLNVGDSPAREDDDTPAAAVAAGHLSAAEPPDAFDLRAPWWGVGDQGETGSCVGWALADSVLRRQLVGAGRLARGRAALAALHVDGGEGDAREALEAEGGPGWLPTTFLEQGLVDVKSALDVARHVRRRARADVPWQGALYPGAIERVLRGGGAPQDHALLPARPEAGRRRVVRRTGAAGSTSTARC